MDTRNSDEFVCVVDCTDCDSVFQEPETWDKSPVGWTAHADGDFLIHAGETCHSQMAILKRASIAASARTILTWSGTSFTLAFCITVS